MKLIRKAGVTSEIFQIFIQDSSSVTGAGLPALAHNSGSLTAYYHRDTDTTATAITLADMTVGTFTSGGFKKIDDTNMPGVYQFCPPDAALAAGAKSVVIMLKGASNMAPLVLEIQLVSIDVDDTVRAGLTALPNAAANAAGGLPISDAGGLDLDTILDAAISTRATPAQILTTALTESYNADGAAGTLAQILFGIQAFLQERSVSGTTVTTKKLNGSTTAMTFTLDDAANPTSITRAS